MARLHNGNNKTISTSQIIGIITIIIILSALIGGAIYLTIKADQEHPFEPTRNSNNSDFESQNKGQNQGIFYQRDNEIDGGIINQQAHNNNYSAYATNSTPTNAVANSSKIVMEQSSGRVLSGQNIHAKLPMASTTKIVTALVVLDKCDINASFTIPKEATGIEGSSIYLKAGEVWTIKDLLYGLMLRSGNDSAEALAIACSGSVQAFVSQMNEKAKEIGLVNTNFCNPSGLHNDNHYTSAYDLAMLSREAMNSPMFCEIVSSKSYTVPKNDTHPAIYFANKNKILSLYDGGNGIKTGYTKKAGRCLVSSAKKNGMQLICVVLNVGDMWNVSMGGMTQGFEGYIPTVLAKANTSIISIPTHTEAIEIALEQDLIYPLKSTESIKFDFDIVFDKNISLPVQKGQIIGKIDIYNDKHLIFSKKISSMNIIQDKENLNLLTNYVGEINVVNNNGKNQQIFSIKRSSIS